MFRWSRDLALRLIAHGKEGPHVFPVPSLLQQVPFCAAFDFGLVGICLVSGSDEQETKFFTFSWQNHAVLLLVVVHLESWSRGGVFLSSWSLGTGSFQVFLHHLGVPPTAIGFLSGLFTPLGCAANGNYGSR